jgi:hypothetical protein
MSISLQTYITCNMSKEDASDTLHTTNNTADNSLAASENHVSLEEEKLRAREKEKLSSTEKQRSDASNETNDRTLEEEEGQNIVAVADNQLSIHSSTEGYDDQIKVQTYSESHHLAKKSDETLSMKAHQAEESVLDLADAVGDKVGSFVKEKFAELDNALSPGYVSAVQDSRNIKVLGPMVEELAKVFEETMTIIREASYEEQSNILTGYKKLIEEQIKVIDSRINMAKRLK